MSEEALAALGTEKAFSVCTAFIKSGGSDGKGTGVSNIPGQGQEERKVRHAASHSAPRSAAGPAQACSQGRHACLAWGALCCPARPRVPSSPLGLCAMAPHRMSGAVHCASCRARAADAACRCRAGVLSRHCLTISEAQA